MKKKEANLIILILASLGVLFSKATNPCVVLTQNSPIGIDSNGVLLPEAIIRVLLR